MIRLPAENGWRAGELPEWAWPGGYPIIYICEDGGSLCPDCANGSDALIQDDPQWNVVGYFLHMEGVPQWCSHCGEDIESAYGPPQEEGAGSPSPP